MAWLYGQTWLWYLIAFAVGVLLAWLFLVRPQARRLRAPESRAGSAAAGPSTSERKGRSSEDATGPIGVGAAGVGGAASSARPSPDEAVTEQDEAATEQLPAVDPALSTLDAGSAFATGSAVERNASVDTTEIPVVPASGSPVVAENAAEDADADGASGGTGDETTVIEVPETAGDKTAEIPVADAPTADTSVSGTPPSDTPASGTPAPSEAAAEDAARAEGPATGTSVAGAHLPAEDAPTDAAPGREPGTGGHRGS